MRLVITVDLAEDRREVFSVMNAVTDWAIRRGVQVTQIAMRVSETETALSRAESRPEGLRGPPGS